MNWKFILINWRSIRTHLLIQNSIRTVRSFVGEPKESKAYGKDIDKSYKVGKKLAFVQGMENNIDNSFKNSTF